MLGRFRPMVRWLPSVVRCQGPRNESARPLVDIGHNFLSTSTLTRLPCQTAQIRLLSSYLNSSLIKDRATLQGIRILAPSTQLVRHFHAKGSKVHYLDFRFRFKPNRIKKNMLAIRRQKMKKHKRIKWRKKFKSVIAKKRLKREIAKEKAFRVELLTYIRRAESFDPKEYSLRKIAEMNKVVRERTKEERLEELKELIRKNRYQTDYVKPKHRKAEMF